MLLKRKINFNFFSKFFFFHLKLSHPQPSRKSLATDENKKYVWKFSWMLNK